MEHFDIIVIGAGGGTKLVRPISRLGKKVAVIEREAVGGTCLNRGCIPSKMLIHPADVMQQIRDAGMYHISSSEPTIDFKALVDSVSETIDRESQSAIPMYESDPNITFFHENATFISPKVIDVGLTQITSPLIVFAPGADVNVPHIPGLDDTPYMTYREALRETTLPKSLIVIGGGYIATELAHMFGGCGSHVDVVVRSEFLKGEDFEIRDEFEREFSSRYSVHKGYETSKVSYSNGIFKVEIKKEGVSKILFAEKLLVATGVTPNTFDIGLEKSGIECTKEGFVKVNDFLETSEKGTYSFGDCLGKHLFRHTANFEGEYLASHLFHGNKNPIDYPVIPHAVFSSPQIGSCGLTEEAAIEKGIEYYIGRVKYEKSAMGMALKSNSGLVKLIFNRANDQLIGSHIVGVEASNMIHMCIAYMQCNATLDTMARCIYIHPALPELIRNAVRDAKLNR